MITYIILFLFLISIGVLIYFTYKPKGNIRLIIKTITSIFFIAICISSYFTTKGNFQYFILILIALICSLLGDILLAFVDGEKIKNIYFFIGGVASFSLAHIIYSIAFSTINTITLYNIMASLLIASITLFIFKSIDNFDFRGLFVPVSLYTFIISFMLCKALSLISLISVNFIGVILIVIGAILFVISDIILSFVFFHKNSPKYMSELNVLTYYIGQGLIALSVMYFI